MKEDHKLFGTVQRGMNKKAEKYGHCPCSLVNDEDYICKKFRESPAGTTCHYGIYTKV